MLLGTYFANISGFYGGIFTAYKDTKIIHIVRYDYDNGLTDKEKSHITECEVNDYDEFDYTIYNTSLDDLYKQADEIVYENMEEVIWIN